MDTVSLAGPTQISLLLSEIVGPSLRQTEQIPTAYDDLLYLSVSTRGVIGQFCGPYFTVR